MIDAALLAKGEALATVDGVTYQAVRLVFACDENEAPALYCALDDWPASHAARIAAKDRELAELATINEQLAAKVLELTQRLNALDVRPKEAPAPKQAPWQSGGAEKRIVCPDCGKHIWPDLFEKHKAEKHPPAPDQPIRLVADDQGWHCKVKGCSGAFARSVLKPDFCTHHAKDAHLNGVETAA